MGSASANKTESSRGRVVMLVDNGVNGDSRVQKAAGAAAAAGWEVFLLGKSPDGLPKTWRIGQAEVELLPMQSPLTPRRHEMRRTWIRRPFAYPPNALWAYKRQWAKARRADLKTRDALLQVRVKPADRGLKFKLTRKWIKALDAVAWAQGKWAGFRTRQLLSENRSRKQLSTLRDRAFTKFWMTVLGDRSWRRLEPRLWDFEIAFGDRIDALKPDLIHANDFYMIGVGARAMLRARAAGHTTKLVWDAHELLSGVKPRSDNLRWRPAHLAHEKEFVPYADAAVTVSTELAEMLKANHNLAELPTVVLNCPEVSAGPNTESVPTLRTVCGLGPDVPLLVYSGAAAAQRGLDVMIDSLPSMPEVHVAFVVPLAATGYIQGLLNKATTLGVRHRVHTAPYVSFDQVVPYLSSADIGVIPIHHWPNHEIALITKFFEYAHARLPMVVSDVRAMSNATTTVGQGEVFKAEDTADFVRAVRAVLADPKRYTDAYDQPGLLETWTWAAQAKILDGVYSRLVEGPGHTKIKRPPPRVDPEKLPTLTINFEHGDTADEQCSTGPAGLFAQFTAPNKKFPGYGFLEVNASVLKLPDDIDQDWWKSPDSYWMRQKVRRALKLGYEFRAFEHDEYLDDLHEVNTSLENRQGRQMAAHYRERLEPIGSLGEQPCPRHRSDYFGVFKDGKLFAYALVLRRGEMILFSKILGHGDFMDDGIMNLLVFEAAKLCKEESNTKYAVYFLHDSGTEGLQFFKRKMGFEGYRIHWKLA